MRKKIIAANWKMNEDLASANKLFKNISSAKSSFPANVEVMIAPSFVFLNDLAKIENSGVTVFAQNCADNESGAFTGEVSASMLQSIGIECSIAGHSERRHIYNESISDITKKVAILLKHNMRVVFCVGEKLLDRKSNTYFDVIIDQLQSILSLEPSSFKKITVAYEPVWAIGTGETASPEQAQEMHAFIRRELAKTYGDLANETCILYGGSVKPNNAVELFSKEDVDGGLVGGASLVADDFIKIILAAS